MTSSFQKEVCCQIAKGSMSSCVVGKNLEASTSKSYPFAAPDSMIYELKKLSKNLVDFAYFLALGFVFFWRMIFKNSRSIKTSHNFVGFAKKKPRCVLEFFQRHRDWTAKVTMAKTMSQRLKRPKAWRQRIDDTKKGRVPRLFLGGKK